jgi:hypothetical protein
LIAPAPRVKRKFRRGLCSPRRLAEEHRRPGRAGALPDRRTSPARGKCNGRREAGEVIRTNWRVTHPSKISNHSLIAARTMFAPADA